MRRNASTLLLLGLALASKVQAVETKPLIQIGVEVVEVDELHAAN